MPVGTSNGEYFENEFDYVHNQIFDKSSEKPVIKDTSKVSEVPSEIPTEPADALEAQQAREVASSRMKQSVAPSGGRQEGPITASLVNQGERIKNALEDVAKHPENLVGTGELGTFIGPARISTIRKLIAEGLEEKGFSAGKIKNITEMERGVEGEWRREISDAGATVDQEYSNRLMKKEGFTKLPYMLDHPELYKSYPDLADVTVSFENDLKSVGQFRGSHDKEGNIFDPVIAVNPKRMREAGYDLKSVLLHEIQHYIQRRENLPMSTVDKIPEDIREMLKEHFKKEAIKNNLHFNEAELNYRLYRALSSEVEAHNVQSRINMSTKEIRQSLGKETEYPDREHQYVASPSELSKPMSPDMELNRK